MKRFSFLDILWDTFCFASIAGIWPRFIEPRCLLKSKVTVPIKNLKKSLSGLKIVHFSDLHFSKKTPDSFLSKIRSAIHEEKPDILVFTGDFLCYSCLEDTERLLQFFLSLEKAPLGNFAVLGNHDYASFVSIGKNGNYSLINEKENRSSILKGFQRMINPVKPTGIIDPEVSSVKTLDPLIDLISKTPFTLLHNHIKEIPVDDALVQVVGLGEYSLGKMDKPKNLKKADLTLTLLHNPDGAPHLQNLSSDLILSGHTHGGQVNLPWLRDRFIVMEDNRLVKGLKKVNGQWIYVSRGVGSVMPFRWFCPPEITSITVVNT